MFCTVNNEPATCGQKHNLQGKKPRFVKRKYLRKELSYYALYKLLFSQVPLQDSAKRACHIQGCHAKSVLQTK
jgi:hypothetical protein